MNQFKLLFIFQLLDFLKDLTDGDDFHVYAVHEINEFEEQPTPAGLLAWSEPDDESVGINTCETMGDEVVSKL